MNLLLWGAFWLLFVQQPTTSSGINFFSPEQDIQIGAEASAEAEKTLPLVRDASLVRYIRAIGRRVVANSSLPKLQYRFQIVNSREVNSIGLPGGAVYVNRGLIEMASSEGELAAILAHEIAHIAGRHGTSQLSRQLLVQAPITIAAGLPTGDGWREHLGKLGVSFGAGAAFLRYNRDQEIEASVTATRLLHEARFDPAALKTLLEKINDAEHGESTRRPVFVFNHPQSEALPIQLEAELERTGPLNAAPRNTAEFRTFHTAMHRLAYPVPEEPAETDHVAADALPRTFNHEYYQIGYPKGWQVTRNGVNGVILTPSDRPQPSRVGNDIMRGLIVDMMDLGERQLTLEQATDRLIVALKQPTRNQQLSIVPGAQTHTLISDEVGIRTILVGKKCRPIVDEPDEAC
ncbi:MAG: M48 family metalloprotease, partial [Acidobacteria bacterium]|nr:M48 family metalloprotease [Acidobacteriota bacterium]